METNRKYRCIIFLFIILIFWSQTAKSESVNNMTGNRQGKGDKGTSNISYIDTHNHLHGGDGRDEDYLGAARAAIKKMDELGISTMFIMPPPRSPENRTSFSMADLLPVVKKYPDRFRLLGGGGSLNLMVHEVKDQTSVSDELKSKFIAKAEEILANGAIGFGEFAAEHFSFNIDHPYESVAPDHPLFLLLADLCAEHNVPMDIHMEVIPEDMPFPKSKFLTQSRSNPKTLKANLSAFEKLISHNRDAKIIWAHVGWCNTGYRTPELCRELFERHPNLYMSFKLSPESVLDTRPLDKNNTIKPGWANLLSKFPERFLIGTDQFYSPPGARQVGPQKTEAMSRLMKLFSEELAIKIGIENPKSIFNLN